MTIASLFFAKKGIAHKECINLVRRFMVRNSTVLSNGILICNAALILTPVKARIAESARLSCWNQRITHMFYFMVSTLIIKIQNVLRTDRCAHLLCENTRELHKTRKPLHIPALFQRLGKNATLGAKLVTREAEKPDTKRPLVHR